MTNGDDDGVGRNTEIRDTENRNCESRVFVSEQVVLLCLRYEEQ